MVADELVKVLLHTVMGGIHGHYPRNGYIMLKLLRRLPLPHQHCRGGVGKSLTYTKDRIRRANLLLHILRIHQIFPIAVPHPNNLLALHVEGMLGHAVVLFGTQHCGGSDLDIHMCSAIVYMGGSTKPKSQRSLPRPRQPAIYAPRNQHPHRFHHLDSADQDDLECAVAAEAERGFDSHFCTKFTVSATPYIDPPPNSYEAIG